MARCNSDKFRNKSHLNWSGFWFFSPSVCLYFSHLLSICIGKKKKKEIFFPFNKYLISNLPLKQYSVRGARNLNKKMWIKRQVTTELQKSLDETQDLVVVKLKYEITWITFRNITVLGTVVEKQYAD